MTHLRRVFLRSCLTAAVAAAVLQAAPALAANTLYWGNYGNDTISFANLDNTGGGGQLDTTGVTPSTPWGEAIDPATNKIYWADWNSGTFGAISFASLGGGGGGHLNTTGATVTGPDSVAIDPATNKIYWADWTNDTISFANLDDSGGGGQLNISGAPTPNEPSGVAIDPATNKLYWSNRGNNTISFANLDDTGGGGQLDYHRRDAWWSLRGSDRPCRQQDLYRQLRHRNDLVREPR